MPTLRLFAQAREAADTTSINLPGETVGELLAAAVERFGERFAAVLAESKVWRNGDPATDEMELADSDEVAVLPPVSGGAA